MRRLNFRSALAIEDLEWLFDEVLTEEALTRFAAVMGTYLSESSHGIVDKSDPTVFSASDSTRPLKVTANTLNGMTVDVSAGRAFSKSAELLYSTQPMVGLTLPVSTVGAKLVVSIKKTEVEFDDRVTDFNTSVKAYVSRPGVDPSDDTALSAGELAEEERDLFEIIEVDDYLALSTAEQDDRVVLAVLTIIDGPALSIDSSRANYAFVRPWFSAADVSHRNQVGSGVVTSDNPHGTALSDLAASDGVTAIQLWTPEGVVVAQETDYAKLAGFKCEEVIAFGQLIIDDGSISGIAPVSGVNAKLAKLTNYPHRLLRVVRAQDGTEISAFIVPGRPLICIPPHEAATLISDLTVTTTAVTAGQPPTGDLVPGSPPRVGANLTSLAFSQPVSGRRELLISKGQEFSAIDTPTLPLQDYGTIPINVRCFLDGEGDVRSLPQVLVCQTKLDTVGSAEQTVSKAPIAAGRLRVGLTGAAAGATMSITIKINGKSKTGASLSETVSFSGASWLDQTPPACGESNLQFGLFGSQKVSVNIFASVSSWQVLTRANDGLNSAIVIYIDPDSVEDALRDVLPLASVLWDGTKTCDLRDDRPVALWANAPHSSPVWAEGNGIVRNLSPLPIAWYVEDFREPRWLDATQSTLDKAYDGCRGRIPDGMLTKGTYVSRPLPGLLTQVPPGAALTNLSVTVYAIPDNRNPEVDPSRCVQSLQLRIYQNQAGGVSPAAISVPSPFFGVAITPSSSPALPGGNIGISRVQVLLTTNNLGGLLKGIVVAIVSS